MNGQRQLERLRTDVQILRTGPDNFRLLDPVSGAHFELRGKERYLLSLIDRCDDMREIAVQYGLKFGQPLAEREIEEFIEQLRRADLLAGAQPTRTHAASEIPHKSSSPLQLQGNAANVFFDLLTLFLGWIVHPIWLVPIAAACLLEVTLIATRWDQLIGELRFARHDMPLPLLVLVGYTQILLMLILPMALLAGICCRRYEGRVRSFGLKWGSWLLPTFTFFTDTGDSLAGMTPRGRRTQIAVGIVAPLALGAIYALCWGASSRASDSYQLWMILIIPCAIAALWQCNPFSMQSSAHWALASAVGDWKLHNRAIEETRAWFWGWTSPEPLSRRERWRLRAYGVAHYLLRFAAELALLAGGFYVFVSSWGRGGACVMLLLAVWWNRSYLAALWRVCGTILIDLWDFLTPARSR